MTTQEFSDGFDALLNSYASKIPEGDQASRAEIVLDEYEKSLFLTKAQQEIVISLYNGKNPSGESFESTEEMRRYLDGLVQTKKYDIDDQVEGTNNIASGSIFFKLPDEVAFITFEKVIFNDSSLGCYNHSVASVYPTTQDEYNKIRNNPFRGPTKYKVIRLDAGDGIVELVSEYEIGKYIIRYLAKPTPIILENLNGVSIDEESDKTECTLNPMLHQAILERAVQMAMYSRRSGTAS